ncbi:hypothetical protein BKA59DRAFT_488321 [Fusarium tricinctum]|uniref:Integral membrane protein n=1 Tax=Fusarium tricinctum TaxID=61284 RepID=A0A8K0W6A5_9HYPO|nr:hypothetical protein BKA59DRAFT_488321 [Fusarium tricinctum]
MVSNQPYNGYQAPPPGQAPQQSPVHYSQGPIQQFPPAQPYPPGQQPSYQTPPSYQHQISHAQPPQTSQGQYPQPHQYPSAQQPTYQSHHPGHSISQAPQAQGHPQQYAPAEQPNYQTSPYGVAAPPTPAQHQQHYQQQAAQFAAPPSAQGQLQMTAQSLLKSGKGFLGNLASNIKSKYPNSPVPTTTSTTSFTGEPPKPTYNPAQHPTQTPLSPTNSFPLSYGQGQPQPQLGHPHHTPPTPQQSVSPAASGYPPIPHQAPHVASPVQHHQVIPGQHPQPGTGPAQYAQQQPQQPQHYQPSGHAGIPGSIPQHVQSPPVGAAPYPQPVLHHQQSNPYQPASPPQGNYYHTQPTGAAASPSHVQSPQVPSPQQQHQSTAPQLNHHASWPQQTAGSNGSFNPAVSSPISQPVSQTAPQVGSPSHPGLHQQPQYHQQPGAVSVYATTSPAPAPQPVHNVAPPPSHVQSPSQAMPPQQQYYQSPVPQAQVHHHQQQAGIVQHNPEISSTASSVPQTVSYTAGQHDSASVAPRPYQTQSPHQQHQSPALQQHASTTPLSQAQQGPQLTHGHHQHEQSAQAGSVPAPAVAQPLATYGQDHNYPPGSSLQQSSGIHSGPIQAASQPQTYSPITGQQVPQAQYPQNPQQTIASPVDQQHHASPPPHLHGHPNTTSIAQAPVSSSAVTGGQTYQPYQPADPLPNLNQPAVLANNSNPDQSASNGYQQDPLASLSTQMSNLNVQNGHQQSATSGASPVFGKDGPRGPPPCQATGMASDTLPFCPEERTVAYPLDWYRFITVPQFLICTRCYSDHVAGSNLAGHFERYHSPEGVESSCGFWSARARETLWPQALQTNDIASLQAFMEKRLTVPACKGRVWSTGADGVKWWGMANNDIDGFISCEACYEDNVVGTGFESRFSPYRQQGQDEKWMCDMCIPYIAKTAVKMSKLNNWNGFVEAAKGRIHLPVCEGRDEESNNGHWILPRRRIKDMTICEACYLDKLALTQFGNEFERHQRAEGFDAFLESIGQRWKCSLTDTAVNMSIALEAAIYRRDFEVFWNAANAICSLVPCTANGIVRGTWWTVSGGCPDYNVCEACYKGILETSNLERFFEPVQRDPAIDIVCNFCPASPRWGMFITKFAEALDKGVFSYYTDYVKKWAGVPTCPGIKNRDKSKWWGHPEALACQDCWLNFVADTPLGESVPVKGVYDERSLICQLWSPRMRKMWLSACAAGPPGSPESQKALDDFRAFGTRRVQVYNATVPHIEMIQQMMAMKRMQAMQQGQLSLMYQGMNSMASISGTTDGYLHGNSSIGYYETENGVTAANMMNNMHSGMADANKMSDWMQIERYRATWMEVE